MYSSSELQCLIAGVMWIVHESGFGITCKITEFYLKERRSDRHSITFRDKEIQEMFDIKDSVEIL